MSTASDSKATGAASAPAAAPAAAADAKVKASGVAAPAAPAAGSGAAAAAASAPVKAAAPLKIGIIGAGFIGSALATHLVRIGHSVLVANSRGPAHASLKAVAAKTGASAGTVQDAVNGRDVTIITITQSAIPALAAQLHKELAAAPATHVLIDTGNYYPTRDGAIAAVDAGAVESRWAANTFGRTALVKVFNNIYYPSLENGARAPGAADRIALPVAGDDAKHKAVVLALVEAIGFDAVDSGTIDESWRQQPGTPCYCADLPRARLVEALAASQLSQIPAYRRVADERAAPFFASLKAK